MHNLSSISTNYNSLGKLLEDLENNPTVNSSQDMLEIVKRAQLFHRDMINELTPFFKEYAEMANTLYEQSNSNEIHAGEPLNGLIEEYKALSVNNVSPEVIYRIAQTRGIERTQILKLLRTLFNYTLEEALSVEEEALTPKSPHTAE